MDSSRIDPRFSSENGNFIGDRGDCQRLNRKSANLPIPFLFPSLRNRPLIKFPKKKKNSLSPEHYLSPIQMRKCSAQKQNIFYPLRQLPRRAKKSFSPVANPTSENGQRLDFCFRFLSGIGQQRDTEANMFAARVNAKRGRPPSRCHHRAGGKKPSQLYREISWRNFHKFRHRASKWLPVERSDIVDNRHVARGEFNIAFAPVLVQLHHFHRLYPPFTLALFHPLRGQRCALLRARYLLPLHRSPLSLPPRNPSLLALSLALFRKFSPEPRSDCAARDYHMN